MQSHDISKITPHMIAGVIDHTYLEVEGIPLEKQAANVERIVGEAVRGGAFAVCVRESMVSVARKNLDKLKSKVKLASVIGFPLGDKFKTEEKLALLEKARKEGADEFDMVIPYLSLKENDLNRVYQDVFRMSVTAESQVLKVIFENVYLSKQEKCMGYEIVKKAFFDSTKNDKNNLARRFFKTSTGFAKAEPGQAVGATLEDVKVMYQYTQGKIGLKPSGGISTLEDAKTYLTACGVPLISEGRAVDPYRFRIGSSSLLGKLSGAQATGG